MFPEFIAFLFMSRDYGHRAHLRTRSYAQHQALGSFYDELTDLIDTLTESYQGRYGLVEIPVVELDAQLDPLMALQSHLQMVEGVRKEAIPQTDTALSNIVDEIVAVYLRTIYKLKFLE